MANAIGSRRNRKLSAAFSARLERLEPRNIVQAVVMLRSSTGVGKSGRRQSGSDRQAAIDAARRSAQSTLADIDAILKRWGGKRLSDAPDALGAIVVQTTRGGITALAKSGHVKAILEDQSVFLVR